MALSKWGHIVYIYYLMPHHFLALCFVHKKCPLFGDLTVPLDKYQIRASLFMRGTLRDLRRRAFKPCIRMNIITTRSATIPSWPNQACSISYQSKTILRHCAHYLLSFLKFPYMNKLEIKWYCNFRSGSFDLKVNELIFMDAKYCIKSNTEAFVYGLPREHRPKTLK